MRNCMVLLLSLMIFGCTENPETLIVHLNGYWEIDAVTLSDGSKRDYTFNDTIDYIEVSDSLTGFRRKLKPNLFGSYETSKNLERFSIKFENDSLNLYYQTPYDTWKETVLEASETHLLVANANNNVYLYKRYQPLDIN